MSKSVSCKLPICTTGWRLPLRPHSSKVVGWIPGYNRPFCASERMGFLQVPRRQKADMHHVSGVVLKNHFGVPDYIYLIPLGLESGSRLRSTATHQPWLLFNSLFWRNLPAPNQPLKTYWLLSSRGLRSQHWTRLLHQPSPNTSGQQFASYFQSC